MPQERLDDPEVGAAAEEMRGERVPERVRGHPLRDAGRARPALHQLPDRLPAERLAAGPDEDPLARAGADEPRPLGREVDRERLLRAPPERHDALLAALAHDRHEALVDPELRARERGGLADAQARRVHELEQRAIAERAAGGRRLVLDEPRDVARAERARQP